MGKMELVLPQILNLIRLTLQAVAYGFMPAHQGLNYRKIVSPILPICSKLLVVCIYPCYNHNNICRLKQRDHPFLKRMSTLSVRVLIVANDPLARAGLAALLATAAQVAIVGQVSANDDLPEIIDVYLPDALLFDLGWDPSDSIDQLANLNMFDVPTLVLLPKEAIIPDIVELGVAGLMLREAASAQISAALTAIAQGIIAIDPMLFETLLPPPETATPTLAEPLTPREIEVLQQLAQGLSNKAIAKRLSISNHTVKFHVNAIMSKLNAQSRTEAVVKATQLGLIML